MSLIPFFLKKVYASILTLLSLMTLLFFVLRLAPGGPFDSERAWPAEIQANREKQYGLDRPLIEQYFSWLKAAAKGDFKESIQYYPRTVSEIIGQALPQSFALGFLSLAIAVPLGICMGCLSAWRQEEWPDWLLSFFSLIGNSIPPFLLASLLIFVFALRLEWLPAALWEGPQSAILPALTLAIRPIAMVAQLTRASMIETLHADFIRTAQAKGLSIRSILLKHALKNSLIPVITLMAPIAAALLTGSFIVETIFQIPGLGKHFVQGILNRDYPLVMGVSFAFGVILLSCQLLVDLAYGWIDPRIRFSQESK